MRESWLEVNGKNGGDIAVGLNLFVGPLACQSELSPFANVCFGTTRILRRVEFLGLKFPSSGALGTEDAIQLIHRELRDLIVLVDYYHRGPQRATFFVPSGRDRDFRWLITERVIERHQISDFGIITHRGQIRNTRVQSRDRALTAGHEVSREHHIRVIFLEAYCQSFDGAFEFTAEDPKATLHFV